MNHRSGVAERIAKRARNGPPKHRPSRRPDKLLGPLPMNHAFWHDIEIMHLRCERFKAYAPQLRRDMETGVR